MSTVFRLLLLAGLLVWARGPARGEKHHRGGRNKNGGAQKK